MTAPEEPGYDWFAAERDRMHAANDRMVAWFREAGSYEEWLLKVKADRDVSDYAEFVVKSLGLPDEAWLWAFLGRLEANPGANILSWTLERARPRP